MEPRRIDWTRSAQRDLHQIRDWIARDSVIYARRMVRRIRAKVEGVRLMPEAAAAVSEWNREDVREVFEGPYRIIFQVEESRLLILAVIHGARLLTGEPSDDEGGGDEE